MTDPKSPAQIMNEQDNAAYARLQHCSVLTYCWAIENGHRTFYDLNPPSIVALETSAHILLDNPEAFGQHYLDTLMKVLGERTAQLLDYAETQAALQRTKTFQVYPPSTVNAEQSLNA